MNSVISNKISNIFTCLNASPRNNVYNNPFQTLSITRKHNRFLHCSIVKDFIPWDKSKSYKGCNASGTYNNHICEIVIPGMVLTEDHHKHLRNICDKWSIIPCILYVVNRQVINIIPYDIKEIPNYKWVSASKTRNFMLDDPLIDYLENIMSRTSINSDIIQYDNKHVGTKRKLDDSFTDHIMNMGEDFEDFIINHIKERVGVNEIVTIGKNSSCSNIMNFLETKNAILNNIPIIYQAVLWNDKTKMFGVADLIIKVSMSKQLFPTYSEMLDDNDYQVFEIKSSTVSILSDGISLNNDKIAQTYKAQVWMYVQLLNKLTNQNVKTAYIIGRRYKTSKKAIKAIDDNFDVSELTGFGHFNMIAKIDFSTEQSLITKTKSAIKWIKEIKTNKTLTHDPPNDDRLFPNMKNHNQRYEQIKQQLATKNAEITQIYRIGVNERKLAFQKNIFRADDPRLNVDILQLKNSETTKLIKNIIDVNKNDCDSNILYFDLKDKKKWHNVPVKAYVDIETINSTAYNLNHIREVFVFMIGVAIVEKGIWRYYTFTVNELTSENEQNIFDEFSAFMNMIQKRHKKRKIPIYHWSHYEQSHLLPLTTIDSKFEWIDMLKWIKECGICVNGAFDFSLKNYARALLKLNLIETEWPEDIKGGLDAMHSAYEYYNSDRSVDILSRIEAYNEVDCKSMFEIHNLCSTFV